MPSSAPISGEKMLRFDGLMIDRENFSVFRDGNPVSLTPRAFDVLFFLAERRDRVVEKQELFSEIWKDTFVTDNALTKVIKEIRQAVGDEVTSPRFIETVPKRGYRFLGVPAEQTAPPIESPAPVSQETAPVTVPRPEHAGAKTGWWIFAAFGLIAVLGLAYFFPFRAENIFRPTVAALEQVTNTPELDDFPALSPSGNEIAYCSTSAGSFEIFVKQLTPGAAPRQITRNGGGNTHPVWSPDGQMIAFSSQNRGGIWVVPASGGEPRQITEFGARPAWSPEGKRIAFQSQKYNDFGIGSRNAQAPSTIWTVNPDGSEPLQVTKTGNPSGGHGAPAWSPDGRRIAFENDEYHNATIWTVAADGSGTRQVSTKRGLEPQFAPDGKSIFFVFEGLNQVAIEPATGKAREEPRLVKSLVNLPLFIRHVTFSRDGKKMAMSSILPRNNISSVKIRKETGEADGSPTVLLTNSSLRNNYPAFSPDGSKIAYTCCNFGGSACDLWVMNSDGSNPTQMTTDAGSEMQPNWFPDGKNLSFFSNRTGSWTTWTIDAETKRERQVFNGAEYGKLTRDGKTLVYHLTRDGISNVWEVSLPDGTPRQLTFDKEFMGFPTVSPDGKTIALQGKRGSDTFVFLMPRQGGKPEQLSFIPGQSWIFDWSPDGDKILFAGLRNGVWNVWWISRTTHKEYPVTHYTKANAFLRYPAWSPKGDQIVYEFSETLGNILLADLQ